MAGYQSSNSNNGLKPISTLVWLFMDSVSHSGTLVVICCDVVSGADQYCCHLKLMPIIC